MTDEKYEKIFRKARAHAWRKRQSDTDAEDFAQDVLLDLIENPLPEGIEPNLTWEFRAFIEKKHGREGLGVKFGRKREPPGSRVDYNPEIHEGLTDEHKETTREIALSTFAKLLRCCRCPLDHAVISLRYAWGFDDHEIAAVLGVGHNSVSQRFMKVKKRFHDSR